MPDLDGFSEFQNAVNATGGAPGTHWLGGETSKLYAEFYYAPIQNDEASEIAGRPIFDDKLAIKVFQPGGDVMSRLAHDEDKEKWPHAWAAFEKGNAQEIHGTPLKEWPQATPSVVASLNAVNVFNVEGLAALSDAHCEKIGNLAFVWRDKAQAFLKAAEGQNQEIDDLKAQNAAMADQLKAMQKAIDEMNKPKRRGRPPGSKTKVKQNVARDDDTGDNGPSDASAS